MTVPIDRGPVLWRQIGQPLRDFQNPQLAREGLPSWCHLLLAHSGTEKPGQNVLSEFILNVLWPRWGSLKT